MDSTERGRKFTKLNPDSAAYRKRRERAEREAKEAGDPFTVYDSVLFDAKRFFIHKRAMDIRKPYPGDIERAITQAKEELYA